MTKDNLTIVPAINSVERFEEHIPVRGCQFDLLSIKVAYSELQRINFEYGEKIVSGLDRDPDMTESEWSEHQTNVLNNAFRLSVTITGQRDIRIHAEDAEIFTSQNLPKPIKNIYINNIVAYSRNANGVAPSNKIEVFLDFDKPAMFDPNPLVSEATLNDSSVQINADDMSFFRAIQQVVDTKFTNQKTLYNFLHKNFVYDLGLWLFALPVILLLSTIFMDRLLPASGQLGSFRWAFFIYAVGTMLLVYRFLSSYTKWAFPVNVLTENKDVAWRHRLIIGGVVVWLFYKSVDTIYDWVIGLSF